MLERQIPVELMEINDKVIILKGDEFDHSFLDQLKKNLKKKGLEPAAIVLLPDLHEMLSADKQETIDALKQIIQKLESA